MKLANNSRIVCMICTLLVLAIISGCSGIRFEDKDGSVHHLIIGIGIISTPKNNGEYGVLATKSQILGIHASDQPGLKLGVGYSSSSVVTIPDDSENVVIEIYQAPFGQLSIKSNPQVVGE